VHQRTYLSLVGTHAVDGREVPKMNTLVILNDPPYGTERSHNGLIVGTVWDT